MSSDSKLVQWLTYGRNLANAGAHLVDLGIRIYVAKVFFLSGLTKIRDWDVTLSLFQDEYHVPLLPPGIAALLGTFGELVFPIFLVLGLGTRFAALGLSFVNAMAVISYWHVLSAQEPALAQHVYWGALLLVPLFYGPGRLALDRWLAPRLGFDATDRFAVAR
jgi:putative oxidoreductase